jgi:hypothetical protein
VGLYINTTENKTLELSLSLKDYSKHKKTRNNQVQFRNVVTEIKCNNRFFIDKLSFFSTKFRSTMDFFVVKTN